VNFPSFRNDPVPSRGIFLINSESFLPRLMDSSSNPWRFVADAPILPEASCPPKPSLTCSVQPPKFVAYMLSIDDGRCVDRYLHFPLALLCAYENYLQSIEVCCHACSVYFYSTIVCSEYNLLLRSFCFLYYVKRHLVFVYSKVILFIEYRMVKISPF
jgi:hypothetical protein